MPVAATAGAAALWKVALRRFADETGLTIDASHFPRGTSRWNGIEHRLFACISAKLARQAQAQSPVLPLRIVAARIILAAAGGRCAAAPDPRQGGGRSDG
jgi:hypothetical protein